MNAEKRKTKIIITGATGMVGEGVLHECLSRDEISEILVVGRRPCGITHHKIKEIIHEDFFDLSPIESLLAGYDACFFCLGVSSVGMKEEKYERLTYTLTMHFAETLVKQNSFMIFCYISGSGTDSTEKGRLMWARIKGKTENGLMKLPFKKVYNFRPAILTPTKGLKNTLKFYRYFGWLVTILKTFKPKYISSLRELGLAMISVARKEYGKSILEVNDIKALGSVEV